MKTKDMLEKAGWTYLCEWGRDCDVYARGVIRIIYDSTLDKVYAYYVETSDKNARFLFVIDDSQLEIFTQQNENKGKT